MANMTDDDDPVVLPAIPTATLLRWQDHRTLSDAERLKAFIEYVNTGSLSAYRHLYSGVDLGEPTVSPAQQWWNSHRPPAKEGSVQQPGQLELRQALAKVESGKVSTRLAALWRRRAAGLVFVRTNGGDDEARAYLAFKQWKSGPTPAEAHLLLLLQKNPKKLCRCEWEKCGLFFFKPARERGKRGAPIHKYCPGSNHRALARKAAAQKRMRALRAQRGRKRK
jgi:hypothetical protein